MDDPVDRVVVFGPVPSRRLGRSLGVKNVAASTCTYDCVYCQMGRTANVTARRGSWYDLDAVLEGVALKQARVRELSESIDYVTFVPDGEPTLDVNLGQEIEILRSVGMRTAILTNASLINRREVRGALRRFDYISVKVDTVDETTWLRMNRPHPSLNLGDILAGLLDFTQTYSGVLDTETMLVDKLNDDEESLGLLADYLRRLRPRRAFLSIPSRPPSELWVRCPTEAALARAYAVLVSRIDNVQALIDYEGDAFTATGDPETDLLSIAGVHPLRESAVKALIDRSGATWEQVNRLVERGQLVTVPYDGKTYYVRRHHGAPAERSTA